MSNWLKIGIVLGLIHWGATAFAGWATPSCMEGQRSYKAQRCSCIKLGYRTSLVAERLILSSLSVFEGGEFERNMRNDLQDLYERCW